MQKKGGLLRCLHAILELPCVTSRQLPVKYCVVCVLVWRWAITGTLDPVRNLTGLNKLDLDQNSIGGMIVRTVVGIAAVVVALACGWQWCGATRQHRCEISRWRIISHAGAVWMVEGAAVVLMLGQYFAARQPVVCMPTCVGSHFVCLCIAFFVSCVHG